MVADPAAGGRNGQGHSLRLSGIFRTISPICRRGRPMCLPAGRHCEFAAKRTKQNAFPPGAQCAPLRRGGRCCRIGKWLQTRRLRGGMVKTIPNAFLEHSAPSRQFAVGAVPCVCPLVGTANSPESEKNRTLSRRAHNVRPYRGHGNACGFFCIHRGGGTSPLSVGDYRFVVATTPCLITVLARFWPKR